MELLIVRQCDVIRIMVPLSVTCLYAENACIYSCQSTTESREDELRRILAGAGLVSCPTVPRNLVTKTAKSYILTNYTISITIIRLMSIRIN